MFVKILEPEERTAALINLTANMLYLENNAQSQYSEVRILGLGYHIFNILFIFSECVQFLHPCSPEVRCGIYVCFLKLLRFTMGSRVCWARYWNGSELESLHLGQRICLGNLDQPNIIFFRWRSKAKQSLTVGNAYGLRSCSSLNSICVDCIITHLLVFYCQNCCLLLKVGGI